MAIQTREEYYALCVKDGLPLPEIIRAGDVVARDVNGNRLLVRDEDITATDIRDINDDGSFGNWRKL